MKPSVPPTVIVWCIGVAELDQADEVVVVVIEFCDVESSAIIWNFWNVFPDVGGLMPKTIPDWQ